jgi:hypothetical protein
MLATRILFKNLSLPSAILNRDLVLKKSEVLARA